jgi:hypothetical protein
MFSQRPMDLAEVVEAVAVTAQIRSLNQLQKNRLRRPADVFQLCGSLVHQSQFTRKISLAHFSVQEFLSRPYLEKGRQNQFFLQEMISQRKLFETCISYLSLEDFGSETFRETFRLAQDMRHTDSDLRVFAGTPFLEYASNYWVVHFKSLGSAGMQLDWPLLETFLFGEERSSFESWILVSQYIHRRYKFPNRVKAIHVAVLYSLKSVTPRYPDIYIDSANDFEYGVNRGRRMDHYDDRHVDNNRGRSRGRRDDYDDDSYERIDLPMTPEKRRGLRHVMRNLTDKVKSNLTRLNKDTDPGLCVHMDPDILSTSYFEPTKVRR